MPGRDERAPNEKRPTPGRIRAIGLAIAVHALFIAVIVFGVTWQSAPTAPVQAELWDKLPPAKSTVAKAEPPKPEPPKPEPPKPEPPKPEPPKPEPPKPQPPKPQPPKPEPKVEPPKPDPAIALKAEKEKREKAEREKAEKEKREKAEREKAEREKAEREKAEKEKAQKKREEQQRREQAEEKKREDAERLRQQQLAQAEAERAQAAAAAAKQKEFNEWIDKIRARIRGRANVPDSVTGQPEAQFLIRILPGGEVLDITLRKSSGNPAYDNAIERAIRSASPLPVPPPNSELFPRFRELNLVIKHER